MKKILAIALCAMSFTVAAKTLRAPNNAGGEIVLTAKKCTEPGGEKLLSGYSYAGSGTVYWFCYAIVDDGIMVVYDDGTVKRYPLTIFSAVP